MRLWKPFVCLFAANAVGSAAMAQGGKPGATAPTYAHDIRPILQARCVVCHNKGTLSSPAVSGGLALDSFAALRKGSGRPLFVAGKSSDSELMRRLVATSPSKLMPRGGPALSAVQIALVKRWIDGGAPAGTGAEEAPAEAASPAAVPMPANPGALDVSLTTRVKPTPDLLAKDTPKDASLAFTLKVGPLPPVTALAYSPDGKLLAIGGYRAATLWDTATGRPTATLSPLAGAVMSFAFRPDGTQLAVAGGAPGSLGEVRIYDTKTYAPVGAPLTGHTDVIYSVAWNPTGTRLATASQDRTARIFEWPSGKELKVLKDNSDAVTRVCFTPDGKSLYTASQDHNLRRFDAESGQVQRVFSGHSDAVTALALSPDGKGLVSSGPEPRLRWWNPDTGDTTRYGDGSGATVTDIVFSKDGKILASAAADHYVRLWDAGSAGQQRALEGADDWLYTVALSPDGKFAAGGGAEGITRVWEVGSARLRLLLLSWPPTGKSATSDWIAVTPEGFYEGTPTWIAKLRAALGGKPLPAARLADFLHGLEKPDNVVKAWQGQGLDTPVLPPAVAAPKPAVPTKLKGNAVNFTTPPKH